MAKHLNVNSRLAKLRHRRGINKCMVLTWCLIGFILGNMSTNQILKIKPITGRTHQIRAQLAHIGLAIKGDVKYGFKRGERDRSIFLHASEVEVEHPVSGEILKIKAPVPNSNLWKIADSFIK